MKSAVKYGDDELDWEEVVDQLWKKAVEARETGPVYLRPWWP